MIRPLDRAAKIVTDVLAPWVVIIVACGLVAADATGTIGGTLLWGSLVAVFTSVIPMGVIAWGIRRGRISDVHVRHRSQRIKPLAGIALSATAGLTLMWLMKAPGTVVALSWALAIGVLTTGVITVFWKISFHTAVSSATAVVIGFLFGGGWAITAIAVVATIGWSRVRLGDHTVAQVLAGAAWGAAIALAVFGMSPR
ncbi:hypothetical protein FB566_2843 [Stackebrandtia endophytica]|uniref:PAP2 superfamily protein n=1 Tax=Stackebrandtia endophytica TaxID=1496996 RepID=A0A543AXJ6_9ACTN|nr:phosphatase PAP2 family protein [Stackebrandtia endophytica]TQL77287.1 hypothetical protein FB566_2843 [Stackebrandtia endophytica]